MKKEERYVCARVVSDIDKELEHTCSLEGNKDRSFTVLGKNNKLFCPNNERSSGFISFVSPKEVKSIFEKDIFQNYTGFSDKKEYTSKILNLSSPTNQESELKKLQNNHSSTNNEVTLFVIHGYDGAFCLQTKHLTSHSLKKLEELLQCYEKYQEKKPGKDIDLYLYVKDEERQDSPYTLYKTSLDAIKKVIGKLRNNKISRYKVEIDNSNNANFNKSLYAKYLLANKGIVNSNMSLISNFVRVNQRIPYNIIHGDEVYDLFRSGTSNANDFYFLALFIYYFVQNREIDLPSDIDTSNFSQYAKEAKLRNIEHLKKCKNNNDSVP